jgi:hypothetical protein
MPYIVTTTAGSALATVPDNTVNTTTTSLALVGKNYAGYGAFLNENYVKLLENFSNSTAPNAPLIGQLWYDSVNRLLKVYTGSDWKQMHTSAASSTAPNNPVTGDLWWDTTNLQFKVWGGSLWVVIGPASTASATTVGGSTSGAIVDTIVDSTTLSHTVIKFSIANQVIAIISKDTLAYTPVPTITGFSQIYPGLNLINSSGFVFTGNATNALSVNNVSSTSFLRSDQNATTTGTLTISNDTGTTIGNTSTHTISVVGGAIVLKNNTVYSDMNVYVNKSGVSTQVVSFAANSAAVLPGVNNTTEIGSNSQKFANVWSTYFRGTAITASYADLAEIYLTDTTYDVGTVVKIGGTAEVTAATYGDRAIGVISENPAFLMNNTAEGQPVALKGRVPVRVQGTVNKGDKLIPAQNIYGAASTIVDQTDTNYFAIAIGENQQGTGIVECLIL